jgi:AcrR family transcriptional regulator
MSSKKRKYELKIRAERQRQTRERIVAATVSLHEEVGPARTTVAEIARRAGVQRLTVYNSFPDEVDLFAACQAHYFAAHPPPDPTPAFAIEDPTERLHAVLSDLYPWYRKNQPMLGNSLRDRSLLPALDALLVATVDAPFTGLAEALAGAWARREPHKSHVRSLIGVVLDFRTWQRLAHDGLADPTSAALMARVVGCAGSSGTRARVPGR